MNDIFCNLALTEKQVLRLKGELGETRLHLTPEDLPEASARPYFEKSEIVFGNPPASWLQSAPLLRWTQLESVGFGEYLSLDWLTLGQRVTVTNLSGFFADPVAESILAGVLTLYRGIDHLVHLKQDRNWQGDALRPQLRTLRGASVVLFGQGAINTRFIELLAPFGCHIERFGRGWTPDKLDEALSHADLVVSTVPDTLDTRGVFDQTRFSKFKHGAMFANFGRGSAVDDDALARGLASGAIGGAVLDVTRDEPLPIEHHFWQLPNLILTQHSGGGTHNEIDRKIDWFLDNLARYRRGERLHAIVDFSRGY